MYKMKIILFVVFVSMTLFACKEKVPELVKGNQFVLGTFGQIQGYTTSPEEGTKAINKAYQRIHEIENLMSTTIEDSEIYRLNQNAGHQSLHISQETLNVIEKGLEYYQLTDGNFNIGLGKLSNLWGLNIETDEKTAKDLPTEEEIKEALEHIDIHQLELNGPQVFIKDPEMSIDLGGIAKGYAVDEAAKVLMDAGIESGFINLGGDIFVLGPKPTDGTKWVMGIQAPVYGSSGVIAKIELANRSIVTSGDYQRFVIDEENNKRYHHILDPKTGYPADNELTSVTIISDAAIKGDAFSTAAFIMGLEDGLFFVENLQEVEGIFVTKDKKVYVTSGLKDQLQIIDPSYTLVE